MTRTTSRRLQFLSACQMTRHDARQPVEAQMPRPASTPGPQGFYFPAFLSICSLHQSAFNNHNPIAPSTVSTALFRIQSNASDARTPAAKPMAISGRFLIHMSLMNHVFNFLSICDFKLARQTPARASEPRRELAEVLNKHQLPRHEKISALKTRQNPDRIKVKLC